MRFSLFLPRAAALAAALAVSGLQAAPTGTTFTYQGELRTAGAPAEGAYDFEAALFDVASGGEPLTVIPVDDAIVDHGLFSLPLDFTDVPFATGEQYWIELRVRDGAQIGTYTPLQPRQPLTASPYALTALGVRAGAVGAAEIDAAQVQRRVSANCAVGSSIRGIAADGTVTCQAAGTGTITGVTSGTGLAGGGSAGNITVSIAPGGVGTTQIDAAAVQRRVANGCAEGSSIRVIAQDGSVTCETDNDAVGFSGWEKVTATKTYGGTSGGTSTAGVEARCPAGKRVIGGGVDAGCAGAYVSQSYPTDITSIPPTSGWYGLVVRRSDSSCGVATATMTVYAICANAN
jgi:hypothetical protein